MVTDRALTAIVALLAVAAACKGSGTPPTEPSPPSGPRPTVSTTLGFGESPLEGRVRLTPLEGTSFWRYAVDVDEDGVADHSGILVGEVEFPYRFSAPGVHAVRVSLTGPDGIETINLPAIVNDPSAIQILAQREIPSAEIRFTEGITVNRAGTELFVGGFGEFEILRLNPADLAFQGPPLSLKPGFGGETSIDWGAEGLSTTPSDTLLLVAHNRLGVSAVAIPTMEPRRSLRRNGNFFFIEALSETTALTPTNSTSTLDIIDTRTGQTIRSLPVPGVWHFSVSRLGDRVAVIERFGSPAALRVASLPELQESARIPLPHRVSPAVVAFDPAGDRVYVMGRNLDDGTAVFVLIDVIAGRVLLTMTLGTGPCLGFCVANPVATLASGRFVAMEQGEGALFIDTALDLPRFFSPVGNSVAASPTEEAFFLLRPEGLVSKVAIRP
jgi:hypothetical protein